MSKVRPGDLVYAGLVKELEEWKERALNAERENKTLRRKLKGATKRSDPIERFKRKFTD